MKKSTDDKLYCYSYILWNEPLKDGDVPELMLQTFPCARRELTEKTKTETETENDTTANASTERAEASGNTESAQSASGNMPLIIGGIAAAAAAVAAGIFIKKRKK